MTLPPAHLRLQIGVREEVLACDLSLKPAAPIVEPEQQRIECLVARRIDVVAAKECIAIADRWCPSDVAQLIRGLERPGVRVQRLAIPFPGVLEFKGEIRNSGNRCCVRARIEHVKACLLYTSPSPRDS